MLGMDSSTLITLTKWYLAIATRRKQMGQFERIASRKWMWRGIRSYAFKVE